MKIDEIEFKKLLVEHGYNQSTISELLNTNRQDVSGWIKRKSIPSKHYLPLKEIFGEKLKNVFTKYDIVSERSSEDQTLQKIPYYNVDFIAGFDLLENNQHTTPDYFVSDPLFAGSDYVVRCSGDSMGDKVPNGSYIGIKRISFDDILFGEVYAIVTKSWRTVKYIRKANNPNRLLLVPENKIDYDEQEVEISKFLSIWMVVAIGVKLG